MHKPLFIPLMCLFFAPLTGCGDKDDDTSESGAAAPTAWYSTCGDPACEGYAGPTSGLALCTDEAEGESCAEEGAECDLQTDCNTRLLCATEDPKSMNDCPVSRAKYKHDIRYLSADERDAARRQLLDTRLATWRYRWDAPTRRARLGFIIDDQPGSPAVQADGNHVDLYGYTSLTVAAVQAQEAELQTLRTELTETRAALQALQAEVAQMRAERTAP